jgi:hypothetical protein
MGWPIMLQFFCFPYLFLVSIDFKKVLNLKILDIEKFKIQKMYKFLNLNKIRF